MSEPATFDPVPGRPERIAPGLRRLLAPNPSPMTFRGTNSYLVGETEIAVIDPGPDDQRHLEAILAAVGPGQRISHILVTHAHLDHSPLAARLSRKTGAPVHGFGTATEGRSDVMQALAETGLAGGGEGVDAAFVPDVRLADGATVSGPDWTLRAIHTPGHMGNHLCFALGDACFTGDLVMGWSTSLVSPPDGDVSDFMASCRRLHGTDWRRFFPGHGAPVGAPRARLAALLAHRRAREEAILAALQAGPATAEDLTQVVYADTPRALHRAAARNLLAHLVDLHGRAEVTCRGPLRADATFEAGGPRG